MKKTVVARKAADAMHTAEDAVTVALKASREALAAMRSTKLALDMVSPETDAAIARWQENVELLEAVEQGLTESHKDAYKALQDVKLRGFALWLPPMTFSAESQTADAA